MSTSVPLEDILEVQNGFAFKSEFFTNNGGNPLIRIRDLPNASTETNYSGEYRSEFLVQPGDFLIGMDGDFRCVRWSGLEGLLNQRVCRLRNFSAKVEPDFVFHAIGKKLDDIHSTTSFVTVKHLSSKQILKIEIPLPPLPEQRRIVDILNRANGIRRLRREAQEKARQVIPALFVEMFGDPQRNPRGWPIKQLNELVRKDDRINYGVVQPGSDYDNGVPIVRIGDFRNDCIRREKLKKIDPEIEAKYARSRLRGDEVLIACVGSIGNIALADPSLQGHNIVRAVTRVPLSIEVDRNYVAGYLATPYVQRFFVSETRTVNQPTLNIRQIKETPILLPPLPLQQTFASRVADIQAMIAQQDRMAAASERLVNSLMAEVFG